MRDQRDAVYLRRAEQLSRVNCAFECAAQYFRRFESGYPIQAPNSFSLIYNGLSAKRCNFEGNLRRGMD